MKRTHGFTLIELLITITIMVILMTLAVVNIRGTLVKARDEERKSDVENIARSLEQYYAHGVPDRHFAAPGGYPGMWSFIGAHFSVPKYATTNFLPDLPPESLFAPNAEHFDDRGNFYYIGGDGDLSDATINNALDTNPIDQYLYHPLTKDGTFCEQDANCVRYTIYYRTEVDGVIHRVKSRHR